MQHEMRREKEEEGYIRTNVHDREGKRASSSITTYAHTRKND